MISFLTHKYFPVTKLFIFGIDWLAALSASLILLHIGFTQPTLHLWASLYE